MESENWKSELNFEIELEELNMIIRKDDDRNYIERNGNDYSMYINGWYAGGFALSKSGVKSDTQAIEIYKRIKKFETED